MLRAGAHAGDAVRRLIFGAARPAFQQYGGPSKLALCPRCRTEQAGAQRWPSLSRAFTLSIQNNAAAAADVNQPPVSGTVATEETAASEEQTAPRKRRRRTKAELQALADAGVNPKTGRPYRELKKTPDGTRPTREDRRQTRASRLASENEARQSMVPFSKVDQRTRSLWKDEPTVHEHLPIPDFWPIAFKSSKRKNFTEQCTYFISNKDTIARMLSAMKLDVGPKKTVIEAYAGAGTVTSALAKHPSVEKVIPLEETAYYGYWLERLPENDPGIDASKIHMIKRSGFDWGTYTAIYAEGALDHLSEQLNIPKLGEVSADARDAQGRALDPSLVVSSKRHADPDWQADSPLVFFAHMPNSVHGELLLAQILTAIATRSWLFHLGRVKICLVCSESMARRLTAQPGDTIYRAKIGTVAQSLAHVEWHIRGEELLPFKEHVYPPTGLIGLRLTLTSSAAIPNDNVASGVGKQALSFLMLEPRKQPLAEKEVFEAMDYLMRKLYVLKAKSVHEALMTAAPGASDLLNRLSKDSPELARDEEEIIDPSMSVNCLTNKQWVALARAFDLWPFRPAILMETGLLQDASGSRGRHR